MRTKTIWVIAHPNKERVFTETNAPTKERSAALIKQGYWIFQTTVTFPPIFVGEQTIHIESSPLEHKEAPDGHTKS